MVQLKPRGMTASACGRRPPRGRGSSIRGKPRLGDDRLTSAAKDEPEEGLPYEAIAGTNRAGILLICDHASNRIPRRLAGLGVAPAHLQLHVAWDIGAAALTRALAARLGAPAVLSRVSRLVIDCNRAPGHATSIPPESHGVPVPGNRDLSPQERAARERGYHEAYHARIAEALASDPGAMLVSMHSFTPILSETRRPWHLGILSDRDRRAADLLLASLRGHGDLVVGDNEPYSGRHGEGYTCRRHGDAQGRANVLIEVRQDLLSDDAGVAVWAERLAEHLVAARRALDRPAGDRATGARGAA
jgi:predicted N-formylglutamate amidohydrolase